MSSPGSSGSPGSPAGSPASGMLELPRLDGRSPESGKRVLEPAVLPPRSGDEIPQHGDKSLSVCGRSSSGGVKSHQSGTKLAEHNTQSPDDEPKEIWLFTVKPPQRMKKPSYQGIQSPHDVSELPQPRSRPPQSGSRSLEDGIKSLHSGGELPQQGAKPPDTGGRLSEDDNQSLDDDEVQLLSVKPGHKRKKSSEPDILSTPVLGCELPEPGTMSPQVHGESSKHAIRSPSHVAQSGAEGSLGDGEEKDGAAALHRLIGSPTLQHPGEGTPQENLIERSEKISTDIPGEFEVDDSAIRQGSLSQLQRAWRWTTAQKVVLKYPSQAAWVVKGQKRLRDVFAREAAALQSLRCKNVVECYDFIGDEMLLVLEACDHDLEHQIECSDVRPQAHELMRGVLTGLKSIHGANMTHNDLHPRNIMILDGVPKIGDFGVSRGCGGQWPPETTGTIKPPRRGRAADTHADCWAAGLLMCCLLTNSVFMDEDISTMESIEEGDLDLVLDSNPKFGGISASAKDLIKKLLCLDPLFRISAAEALQHPWFAENDDDKPVSSKKRTRSELEGEEKAGLVGQEKKLKILRTCEDQEDIKDAEASRSLKSPEGGLASKEDGDITKPQTSKKRGRSGDEAKRTSSGSASSGQRQQDATWRAKRKAIMESWMECKSPERSDSDDCFEAASSKKKRSKT